MALRRLKAPDPKLKPNSFAILARAGARQAWLFTVFALILFMAGTALAVLRGDFDPSQRLESPGAPALVARQAEFARDFPALTGTFSVAIESASPQAAERAAIAFAQALAADRDNFAHVFAPGTGEYFQKNRLLYASSAEIERLSRRARQMSPLFQVVSTAPDLTGLAGLSATLSQEVAGGRSPEGLDGLFAAAARSVKAEIAGKAEPLDWMALLAPGDPPQLNKWYVTAKPLIAAEAALAKARAIAATIGGASAEDVSFGFFGEAVERAESGVHAGSGLAIASAMAAMLIFVILIIGLTRLAPILCIVFAAAAAIATTMGLAALAGQSWTLLSAPLPLFLAVLTVGASAPVTMLAEAEKSKGLPPVAALMMAAQRLGATTLFVPFLGLAVSLPLAIGGFDGVAPLLVMTGVGAVLVAVMALTLSPAFERLIPESGGRRGHWLDGVFAGASSVPATMLRTIVAALLLALAAFGAGMLSQGAITAPADVISGSVHVVIPAAAVEATALRIGDLPETRELAWVGSHLPPNIEEKRAILAGLAGEYPETVTAGFTRTPEELRQSLEGLKATLLVTENAAGVSAALRQAAGDLRRTLVLFDSPMPASDAAVAKLDRALFQGLPAMLQRIAGLSRLPPVTVADLDPEIRNRFLGPGGLRRIEVRAKPDVDAAAFMAALNQALPPGGMLRAPPQGTSGVGLNFAITLAAAFVIAAAFLCGWIRRPGGILAALLALAAAPLALTALLRVFGIALAPAMLSLLPLWLAILGGALGIRAQWRAVPPGRAESAVARAALMLPLIGLAAAAGLAATMVPELAVLGQVLALAMAVTLAAVFALAPLAESFGRRRRKTPRPAGQIADEVL